MLFSFWVNYFKSFPEDFKLGMGSLNNFLRLEEQSPPSSLYNLGHMSNYYMCFVCQMDAKIQKNVMPFVFKFSNDCFVIFIGYFSKASWITSLKASKVATIGRSGSPTTFFTFYKFFRRMSLVVVYFRDSTFHCNLYHCMGP